MKLRRYAVYQSRGYWWREFWTLAGARRWRNQQRLTGAHTFLFWWLDNRWVEMS